MKVKGWNNGSPNTITGAGYGIRINKKEDRDRYFQKTWKEVIIFIKLFGNEDWLHYPSYL